VTPRFRVHLAKSTMRICFFGDSFVHGTGDDTCLGWVGRLCAAACRDGRDVSVYNLGIRRDTSADILRRWRREADARLPAGEASRLVFSFGANDCVAGDDSGGTRIALPRALANARAILSEARSWLPILMIGPPPVLDDVATDIRIASLSDGLSSICAEFQVPFLDVFRFVQGNEIWKKEATASDGTHPGAEGYAALATMIGEWSAWRSFLDG
jgi:acyl-CoA thioesterase I